MTQEKAEKKPLPDTLDGYIEQAEEASKPGDICYGLVKFSNLPDDRRTYSWFSAMCNRYGKEHARALVVNILEVGTTVADFDDDPRHFRAWFVATLKAKASETAVGAEGFRVFS
jgi:hypothetical protein